MSQLSPEEKQKQIKKRNKLLRQIEELETKQNNGDDMSPDQLAKERIFKIFGIFFGSFKRFKVIKKIIEIFLKF